MKVRFTPTARSQFLAELAYTQKENRSAAASLRRKCEEVLTRLRDFPESGRIMPEFPDLPFREVIVAPFRFFYRAKEETVWIVAVWHSAQRPDEPSGDEGK